MKLSKSTLLINLLLLLNYSGFAQKQTFDLISYTVPSGWVEKQSDGSISYSRIDGTSWAQIAIYQHRDCESDIQTDFDKDWNELVALGRNISSPEKTPPQTSDGWTIISGSGVWQYNGTNVASILTLYSNNNICIAILCNSTAQTYLKDYQALLGSLDINAGTENNQQNITPVQQSEDNSIIGTWIKSGSIRQGWELEKQWGVGLGGYMTDEYIFNTNGSYQFYSKMFSMTMDKIILIKESGSYKIENNNLIISPVKSVIEFYTKKDGADKWGKLLSSEKRTLEKTAYTFTKHYFEGIKKWNLVLQAKAPTNRDGPFSTNTTFTNAYYFSAPDRNTEVIGLPPGTKINTESNTETSQQANSKTENISNTNTSNAALVGLWTNNLLETSGYMNGRPQYSGGYIRSEYLLKEDGTYIYRAKNWMVYGAKDILFVYETGTYSVTGNQITITPKQGKGGWWKKTNSTKEWGAFVKGSTEYKPEKKTCNFEIKYYSGSKDTALILKTGNNTGVQEYSYTKRATNESLIDNPPGFKTGLEK